MHKLKNKSQLLTNKNPYLKWGLHLVFWIFYFFYPMLQFGNNSEMIFAYEPHIAQFISELIVVYVFLTLLPIIVHKGIYVKLFFLCAILLEVLFFSWITYLIFKEFTSWEYKLDWYIVTRALNYAYLLGIFSAFYFLRKFLEKEKEIESVKKEKYLAELESLKAQINPHFLLNTLNAIYSNSIIEDSNSKTSTSVLQFSEILKYTTYEGRKYKVRLNKEINHIENFINLQLFRLEDKVKLTFQKKSISDNLFITPLLLITFVENAFKYTSDLNGENHEILIKVEIKGSTLFFFCENPFQYSNNKNIKNSGIGLSNTIKRLNLIYPQKHHLVITDANKIYKVQLQIDLL